MIRSSDFSVRIPGATFVRAMILLLLAACPPGAPAQPATGGDSPFGFGAARAPSGPRATARIISDVSGIAPGTPFRLGVLLKISDHWHIYWKTPGEVGLAPEINWNLPEGFSVGELQWPGPLRQYDPALELTSFGYEHEVLLFATVTPPAGLEAGASFEFTPEASWLVCKDDGECIPESAELYHEFKVGDPVPSGDAGILEKYAAQVPVAADESDFPGAISIAAASTRIAPGMKSEATVTISAREPWRILFGPGDDGVWMFPHSGPQWDLAFPVPASDAPENENQVTEVSFKWPAAAAEGAVEGRVVAAASLRIPMTNPVTGESKTWHIRADHPWEIGTGGTNVGSSSSPSPTGASAATGGIPWLGTLKSEENDKPLLLMLLFAFIGGLILNVMPCVLPVLSIKILSFVRQSGEDPQRILRMGLVFGAGVLASFMVLATLVVALQAGGNQVGWGFQLQEPRFVIIMSAIVLAFGLSLFGVFSVELPGAAIDNVEGLQHKEGAAGAFFNGVLATALATPCTAPLLAPALGFAFAQPPLFIYLFFVMIALGLAFPYVLLSARPGWLKFIPKPGTWMETFKQFMGFLLVATVIWLLSVMGSQTGTEGVISTLAFLGFVSLACWMIGIGFDLRSTQRKRGVTAVLAAGLIAGSYLYFPEAHLRAMEAISGDSESRPESDHEWSNGITLEPFSAERVKELTNEGRTVFVDFTADWCFTCKVNEKTVLSTDAVGDAMREHDVAVLIADYTRKSDSITAILRQFGRAGVPMYVIFPADRPQEPVLLPEVLTPSIVISAIEQAAGAAAK